MNDTFGNTWKKIRSHLPDDHFEYPRSNCEDPTIDGTIPCRDCERRKRRWFRHSVAIPWTIALVLLAFSITLELSSARIKESISKDYWTETDFRELSCLPVLQHALSADARWSETVKETPATTKSVRFTAGLRYNEDHALIRTEHPGKPEYVGPPTPELDAAWHDLMGGVFEVLQ